MKKSIEMLVKVEVEAPEGVEIDNDTLRSLAAKSVVKVRSVEVGAWSGRLRGAFAWAIVRASVQAFGAVKVNASRGWTLAGSTD